MTKGGVQRETEKRKRQRDIDGVPLLWQHKVLETCKKAYLMEGGRKRGGGKDRHRVKERGKKIGDIVENTVVNQCILRSWVVY